MHSQTPTHTQPPTHTHTALWRRLRDVGATSGKVSEYELYAAFAAQFHPLRIRDRPLAFGIVQDWSASVNPVEEPVACVSEGAKEDDSGAGRSAAGDLEGGRGGKEDEGGTRRHGLLGKLQGRGGYAGVTYLVSHSHLRDNKLLSRRDLAQREGVINSRARGTSSTGVLAKDAQSSLPPPATPTADSPATSPLAAPNWATVLEQGHGDQRAMSVMSLLEQSGF